MQSLKGPWYAFPQQSVHHAVYSSTKLHAGLCTVCYLLWFVCSLLSVYCSSTACLLSKYPHRLVALHPCAVLMLPLLAHACWGTQRRSSKGCFQGGSACTSACNSVGGVPSVSEPCMLTLLTCHCWCTYTRSSKWCLSRRQRMQWVVYLVCQSPACHALAGCSASAALRQPESRPQPSALGSIPSPAVCESALKQCSLHTRHEAEEAQMAGGAGERRKKRG